MKKPLRNKNGHTMIMALAFMILLFALAGSILMIASYRYQKTYVRIARNQLYLYSTELVEIHSESIKKGTYNKELAETVKEVVDAGTISLSDYAKQYTFRYNMGTDPATLGPRIITNEFSGKTLDLRMEIEYKPQNPGAVIPAKVEDYIQIGDQMTIQYRVFQEEIEYRITADYYCKQNTNVDSAGIIVGNDSFTNMKWELYQYKGQFYTK